jgi:four helix bundle protein
MNNFKQYKIEDIGCWQKARNFRKEIFEVASKYPVAGYKLKHQTIDAVGSIGHNIAEGFGRGSFKENIRFCRISRGSLLEVRDQLYAAMDYGFINQDTFSYLYNLNIDLEQNINGYIGFLKQQMKRFVL